MVFLIMNKMTTTLTYSTKKQLHFNNTASHCPKDKGGKTRKNGKFANIFCGACHQMSQNDPLYPNSLCFCCDFFIVIYYLILDFCVQY